LPDLDGPAVTFGLVGRKQRATDSSASVTAEMSGMSGS
jgi:hypothetical protein